jgi:hypothetical protein
MWKSLPLKLLVLLSLTPTICLASDIYITQNTSGSDTGADCADAHSVSWFNTNQAGGNTYHLCGTFTGAAGATMLTVSAGSAGNVKTILFESGAGMTAPVWGPGTGAFPSGGAININGSYVTIDGGSNGYINATLSGAVGTTCPGGACSYDRTSTGILVASSATNVEIKNLTIQNIYLCNGASACNTNWYTANIMVGTSAHNSNLSIHDNNLNGAGTQIFIEYSGGALSGVNVYNNVLAGGYWGIAIGSGSSGNSTSNVSIYGNTISGCTAWNNEYNNGGAGNGYHCDGIIVYSTSNANLFNIYNNYISESGAVTADVFCTYGSASPGATCNIFNNVLYINNPTCSGVGGGRSIWAHGGSGPHAIMNNTMVGVNSSCYLVELESSTSISRFQNNIVTNENWGIEDQQTGNLSSVDYNLYNTPSAVWNYGGYKSLAQWQALGFDAHGLSANPNLDSSYKLQSGSPAIGAATNLTSLCSGNLAPLCLDKAGATRVSTGSWDIGAYQYSSQTGTLAPPTGLSAIVN